MGVLNIKKQVYKVKFSITVINLLFLSVSKDQKQ